MNKVVKKNEQKSGTKPSRQAARPNQTEDGKENEEHEVYPQVSRKEHEMLKRRALKFEAKNTGYILLIPCDGDEGWYEMGDTSALIYKNEVCEKLGAQVFMNNDYDSFYAQFAIGRVRTRGINRVRLRIKRAGLYVKEEIRDKCVIIELNKKYNDGEIKNLREEEISKQEKINNIAKIEIIDPPLYRMISAVAQRIHKMAIKELDKMYRPTMGKEMHAMMVEVMVTYYEIARKKMAVAQNKQRWKKIYDNLDTLLVYLQILGEQRALNQLDCAEVGEKIIEIRDKVARRMV